MKDDADRMPVPRSQAAYPVTHIDPISAAGAVCRAMADSEYCGVALRERSDLDARLHARTLFGQHKLSAGEISPGLRQQNRNLKRKNMLAIEILMQTIVVALGILQ